ncbi:MAG: hypothetical protein AAB320_07795 [Elusimicrobiota bacterium]
MRTILFLALSLPVFACAGEGVPCGPTWRNGQSWAVTYKTYNPGQGDGMAFEKWNYRVVIGPKGTGWVLVARKKVDYATSERFEVRFSSALTIERVRRFDAQGQPSELANDAVGGGFQSHAVSLPLLDWPLWSRAERTLTGCTLSIDKAGRDAYAENFSWTQGAPWWSSGTRRWGERSVMGMLTVQEGRSRAR